MSWAGWKKEIKIHLSLTYLENKHKSSQICKDSFKPQVFIN